jgi:hypothetical protein
MSQINKITLKGKLMERQKNLPIGAPASLEFQKIPLASGLHLMPAPTKGAKTLRLLGLRYWMEHDDLPLQYLYINEPRCRIDFDEFPTLFGGLSDRTYIVTPENLMKHMVEVAANRDGAPFIIMIDSLTSIIRREQKGAARAGGLLPGQCDLIEELDKLSNALSLIVIATANTKYVTADELDGLCEGYVSGEHSNVLIFNNRGNTRGDEMVTIPSEHLQKACEDLNYGTYKSPEEESTATSIVREAIGRSRKNPKKYLRS